MKREDVAIARLYYAIFGEELKKIATDECSINVTDEDLDKFYRVIGTLSEREQKVLSMRFGYGNEDGQPRPLDQVAKEFNVTRARISQIEHKALRKLSVPDRCDQLPRIFRSKVVEKEADEMFREIQELHRREAELKNALSNLNQLPFVQSENLSEKLSSIDELDLPARACVCLEKAGILLLLTFVLGRLS